MNIGQNVKTQNIAKLGQNFNTCFVLIVNINIDSLINVVIVPYQAFFFYVVLIYSTLKELELNKSILHGKFLQQSM